MRKWSLIKDWAPLGISFVALVVALGQLVEQHSDAGLQMRPVVDFYTTTDTSEAKVGIQILNAGPGVALIRKITYFVDGKEVGDYSKGAAKSGTDESLVEFFDFDDGDSMAVNESRWILFRDSTNKKDLEKFSDFVDDHLAAQVTYCSIFGRCWVKCSTTGMCSPSAKTK